MLIKSGAIGQGIGFILTKKGLREIPSEQIRLARSAAEQRLGMEEVETLRNRILSQSSVAHSLFSGLPQQNVPTSEIFLSEFALQFRSTQGITFEIRKSEDSNHKELIESIKELLIHYSSESVGGEMRPARNSSSK